MSKSPQHIDAIRNYLKNEEIQEELSDFDVNLDPELDDETLLANFNNAVSTLPAQIAAQLRNLNADLADNARAADADLAKAATTGRMSMADRTSVVEQTVAAFSRGLEDLRGVAADFSEAISKYRSDERPLLERTDTFENVNAANTLLADLWHQSVEIARRSGLAEFRRLTGNEQTPELEQLRSIATSRFSVDKEIMKPMSEFAQLTTEREHELRKQRDAEHNRENTANMDMGPRIS